MFSIIPRAVGYAIFGCAASAMAFALNPVFDLDRKANNPRFIIAGTLVGLTIGAAGELAIESYERKALQSSNVDK